MRHSSSSSTDEDFASESADVALSSQDDVLLRVGLFDNIPDDLPNPKIDFVALFVVDSMMLATVAAEL